MAILALCLKLKFSNECKTKISLTFETSSELLNLFFFNLGENRGQGRGLHRYIC